MMGTALFWKRKRFSVTTPNFWNPEWLVVDRRRRLEFRKTGSRGFRYWNATKTDEFPTQALSSAGTWIAVPSRRVYASQTHYLKVWHWLVRWYVDVTFTDLRDAKGEYKIKA